MRTVYGLYLALVLIVACFYGCASAPYQEDSAAAAVATHPFAEVDNLVRNLPLGNVVFDPPRTMEVDDSATVSVVLSPTDSIEKLKQQLPQEHRKDAEVGADIKVSSRMKAALVGTYFDIKELRPAIQAVTSIAPTTWRWTITAKEDGTQELSVQLMLFLEIDGKETPFLVKSFERTVEVEVTSLVRTRKFVENNWQWLASTIVIPLGIWIYKKRNRGQKA